MILSKIYEGTIRGLRFFIVQLFVLTAIEEFLSLFGGGRGFSYLMLFMSLQICILSYTMIFSLFYSFASFKQDIKSAFYPYMLYAGLVYWGIVSSNDWNFGRVTIDSYMLMGWLAPIYGLGVLILKEFIKDKAALVSPFTEGDKGGFKRVQHPVCVGLRILYSSNKFSLNSQNLPPTGRLISTLALFKNS